MTHMYIVIVEKKCLSQCKPAVNVASCETFTPQDFYGQPSQLFQPLLIAWSNQC